MTAIEAPIALQTAAGARPATLYIPLDRILPNRYQVRPIDVDAADIAELAQSIREHGLINPINVRVHPDKGEQFEIKAGHRRRAAFTLLARTDPAYKTIPATVSEATDRQMFEICAVENGQRKELSAIEKAITCRDYIAKFKATQAQAGALVGVGQSAVSHLISLLDLPPDVQQLVNQGEIAEVAARALLPLMHFQPAAVSKIAKEALEEQAADRTEAVKGEISNLLDRKAQSLAVWGRPWPLSWPDQPIMIVDANQAKGEPSTAPACKGCKFAVLKDPKADPQGRLSFCLRKPCFDAKTRAWLRKEVLAASEKLGIPVAAPGESVSVVFAGSYNHSDQQRAAKLVRARLPELRLASNTSRETHGLEDVLGTKSAMLVTTSNLAVTKYLNESKGKPVVPVASKNETPAQAEKRKLQIKELAEERALERMAYNRSRADVLWLVEHTAELVAERTTAGGGMLLFAIEENRGGGSFFSVTEEMRETTEALAKRTGIDKLAHSYIGGAGSNTAGKLGRESTPEMDRLRRQYLAYRKLTRDVASGHNATAVYGDSAKVRKTCQSVATKTFGIELPQGWDVPPIHHTPINCWTCGRFSAAGAGKLTQGDTKEGWVVEKDGAVRCPEHAAKGKPMAEIFSAPVVPIEMKPDRRTAKGRAITNAAVAAQAAVRAQALASKPGHVRGHTQPAPKPSAKKTIRRKAAKKGK